MEKRLFEDFTQKYSLGGAIEHVTWQSDGDSISVSATPEDKQVMSFVTCKAISLDAGDFSIYETSQLRSLLNVLEDEIDVGINTVQGTPMSLKFMDSNKSKVQFVLADPQTIPNAPTMPPLNEFEMEIPIDDNFMKRFIKGTTALSDVNAFTVVDDGGVKFVIGYSDMNTTRISLDVDASGDLDSDFSFSATHLKNIFLANKDVETAKIKISEKGVMYIGFEDDEYKCDYYLPRLTSLNI